MSIDLNKLFNPDNQLDTKSTDALLRAMVSSYTSGFDYLKFKQAVVSMAGLSLDQATSFKSAFTTATTMGLTKPKLLGSAKRYLGVLQGESESFTDALKSQIDRNVGSRESMIKELEGRIAENKRKIVALEQEITVFQGKIDNVDNDISTAQGKIDQAKEKFKKSYLTISEIIKKDIELINSYL